MDIEKLGRYDIIGVLGKGAMGVVYEGRDPNLDRRVAIKTIRVQSLSAEAAIEYEGRFRTEARSAARLHHPNIVSVFDSGQDGNIAYLVMEFVQGDDLKHYLECGEKFSVRSSIVMVHELLMALDHAHRQNVVHRDIKPANLLIEVSGRVKLTDFGVARIQDPDETNLTQVGGAVGTPKYMSPEQAKGQRGDSRSDVFSAGVVLYELLTGRLPFDGENQFVIIHQIVNLDAVAPSGLRPEVPASMDEVMARALAKNPEERYPTAREFALALRAVALQLPVTPDGPNEGVADELGRFKTSQGATSTTHASLRDGSSTGIFGPPGDVSLVSTINHDEEFGGWAKVKDSVDPLALRGFLARFPAGIYARKAQHQLDQLAGGQTPDSDSDATVSHFGSLATPSASAAVAAIAPNAPTTAVSPAPAPTTKAAVPPPMLAVDAPTGRTKKWLIVGMAGLAFVIGVAAFFLTPKAPTDHEMILESAAPPAMGASGASATSAAASEVVAASVSAPAVPGAKTKPPSVVMAAAAAPATAASGAASRAAVKPVVAASQTASPKLALRASAPVSLAVTASKPVVPSADIATVGQKSAGPSAPGQVCSERVFVFKIACVAQACTTERFRESQECMEFKAMEKAREEQRNNVR